MLGIILIYIILSHPTFRKTFVGQILGFEKSYEARRLIIGSNTTCGRTAQNSMLLEVLIFHQTLSTTKVSYIRRSRRTIHVFHPRSNNENEFTILSPFHTTRVLGNTLLQYQVQSAEFKQQNYNKHLTVEYKDPPVPTRRILHTTATLQAAPATGVNNPKYTMYSQDLPD